MSMLINKKFPPSWHVGNLTDFVMSHRGVSQSASPGILFFDKKIIKRILTLMFSLSKSLEP